MENMAAAIDALGSYDVELTRKALSFLVKGGFGSAVKYILPLTVHPDVAIRFFAKKAVRIIRSRQAQGLSSESVSSVSHVSNVESKVSDTVNVGDKKVAAGSSSHKSSITGSESTIRNHHSSPKYKRAFVII